MKKILEPLFQFSAFLFPIVLVLYLVLFLLENVFPGFVSNIFDLNYFLIPVLLFGFLAALASNQQSVISSQQEQNKPATKWDFMLIAGLATLSFVILSYKTADLGWTGFLISIISALLVGLVSIIILVFPETEKAQEEVAETSKRKLHIPKFNREQFNYRKLFLSPIGLSLTGLFLVIIIGGLVFDLYQGKVAEKKAINNQEVVNVVQQPRVEIPNDQLLAETPIFIQNGSGETGKASSMAAFLSDFNFGNVQTGDADNATYQNAYITFNQEDLKVASYVTFLLMDNDKYKIVNMLPPTSASQSGIILIIGQ